MFLAAARLFQAIEYGIAFELRALRDPASYVKLVAVLGAAGSVLLLANGSVGEVGRVSSAV